MDLKLRSHDACNEARQGIREVSDRGQQTFAPRIRTGCISGSGRNISCRVLHASQPIDECGIV